MLKKVLILGAGGFIGKHLVSRLLSSSNVELTLAGLGLDSLDIPGSVICNSGLIDQICLDRCERPDIIFNLAGGASVGASISDPHFDFERTLPLQSILLNKIRTCWPRARIIYLSSAAVYGSSASCATSVNSLLSPVSPYGLHKKLAEQMLEYYQEQYGIRYNIVRPFSVYGPGLNKQLLWDAMNKVDKGVYSFFGTGLELRDWIYVDDLVSLLVGIMENEREFSRVINAGTGIAVSVSEILTMLFNAAGCEHSPEFTDSNKLGDPNDLVCDSSEQAEVIRFFKTPLETGLVEYANWFMNDGRVNQ